MSLVSNVILTMSILDGDEHGKAVEEWGFIDVTDNAGGTKPLACSVFIAGFNYLDIKELKAKIREQPWQVPRSVQLFIKTEGEERFIENFFGLYRKPKGYP